MAPTAPRVVIATATGSMYRSSGATFSGGSYAEIGGVPGPLAIAYGGDKWVAVNKTNPGIIYYSYDSITWTAAYTLGSIVSTYMTKNFDSVIRVYYKGGYYFIACRGGLAVSADGINWNAHVFWPTYAQTAPVNIFAAIEYRPETKMFVAITSSGDVWYSYDANPANWGSWVRKIGILPGVSDMAYGYDTLVGRNVFCAVAFNGDVFSSADGINWRYAAYGNVQTKSNRIVYIKTDDPVYPDSWFCLSGDRVYYTTAPVGDSANHFGNYYSAAAGSTIREMDWIAGVGFAFSGARVTSGKTFPYLLTLPTSVYGSSLTSITAPSIPLNENDEFSFASVGGPIATPTNILPAAGSTINTPGPTLSATVPPIYGNDFFRVQWQIDTVNTFDSSDLRSIQSSDISSGPGVQTFQVPVSQGLISNGTYYVRARVVSYNNFFGPWSLANTFTVSLATVPVPTALTATNLFDYWPTFGATMASYGGVTSKLEFQMATDSSFTNIVNSYMQPDSAYKLSGATSSMYYNTDPTVIFTAGNYYLRARQVSSFGITSSWSPGSPFTVTPSVPLVNSGVILSPSGATSTSHPTVHYQMNLTKNMINYPRTLSFEVQIATNSSFTANLISLSDSAKLSANANAGLASVNWDSSLYVNTNLAPGTQYVRVRALDDFGVASTTFTSVGTFFIAHPPATLPVSPANGVLVNYSGDGNAFSWKFSDTSPGDYQTAYQLVVSQVSDGTVVYDSTKVVSSAVSVKPIFATSVKGVNLSWKVRTWDSNDTVGPYSAPRTVIIIDPPVITVTSPTGGTTATGRPVFSWTVAGSSPQKTFSFTVQDTGTMKTVFSKTGTTQQSFTPPQNVLENNHSYLFRLAIVTQLGSNSNVAINFTATYIAPDAPLYTIDTSLYDQFGYVNIDWSTAPPDAYFFSWTVWRRPVGAETWLKIYSTTNPDTDNFHDWSAITNIYYEYVVTQDADRSGYLLGSTMANPNDAVIVTSGSWWFIDPDDETNNFYLNVTSDSFTDEWEEAEYTVIGRGRAKDIGTHLGLKGSVTASIRPAFGVTARQRYDALRDMRAQNKLIMMRDPFGNFYYMTLGNIDLAHTAGVGSTEMYDVTVQLSEIFNG